MSNPAMYDSSSARKLPNKGDKIAISCPADPPHPAGWYSAVVISLDESAEGGWSVEVEWDGGDREVLQQPDWRELGLEPDQKGRQSSLKDGRLRPHLTYVVRRIRGCERGETISWSIEDQERNNAVSSGGVGTGRGRWGGGAGGIYGNQVKGGYSAYIWGGENQTRSRNSSHHREMYQSSGPSGLSPWLETPQSLRQTDPNPAELAGAGYQTTPAVEVSCEL